MKLPAAWEQALVAGWWQPHCTGWHRALLPLAWLYGLAVVMRKLVMRKPALRKHLSAPGWRAPVPVVVVGNLVLGGAGKTPTVIALVQALQAAGRKPGVVSRGYGRRGDEVCAVTPQAQSAQVGDEPLLIQRRTGAPVWVGRDRAAAVRALLQAQPQVDLIVADDGLQHLALQRDAQVIVFDERGAGNGQLLPAGPLREPLPAAVPARTLVLYNAAAASTPLPGALVQRQLAGAVALAGWWAGAAPSIAALQALRGRPVLAAAGLAHPARFFNMLRALGLDVTELPLPDHHDYTTLPWPDDAADVLVSEKDAVKIAPGRLGSTRVWVVPLDFQLPEGFVALLLAHCTRP